MSDRLTDAELDRLPKVIARAWGALAESCSRGQIRMSIPISPSDDDQVIGYALEASSKLLDEVREARKRIAELEETVQVQCDRINELDGSSPEATTPEEDLCKEILRLQAQVERIQTAREAWARQSRQQYDRIGRALDPVRQKLASGEPARDDATEIECLVRRIAELEAELSKLRPHIKNLGDRGSRWRDRLWARDLSGGDDE